MKVSKASRYIFGSNRLRKQSYDRIAISVSLENVVQFMQNYHNFDAGNCNNQLAGLYEMKLSLKIRKTIEKVGDILRYLRIAYLRMTGISIGKDCMISLGAKLDVCSGSIVIGDGCTITYGCVILSHDHAAGILKTKNRGQASVRLGNNVFIGVNSVVLPNVTIGDNSIIGAGSVVTKDIPPNVVAVGNPAKVIRELSDQINKSST